MDSPRTYWPIWMDALQRQGLTDLAAWALEAIGPLRILGAQALYIGQPLFPTQFGIKVRALAHLLEKESEAMAFATLLKGKPK